jgi:hypothetical protein
VHAVHAVVEILYTLDVRHQHGLVYRRGGGRRHTWAVLGGKNSKENVGLPSARAWASFWEMCMMGRVERRVGRRSY